MRPPAHAVETLVNQQAASFERQVEQIAEAHYIQQTCVEADFVVVGVVAVGTRPTHSDEGYEIPGAGLLVAAHGVREVPHCIGMQV